MIAGRDGALPVVDERPTPDLTPATTDPAWPTLPQHGWRGTGPEEGFPVPFSILDGFVLCVWSIIGTQLIVEILGVLYIGLVGPSLTRAAAIVLTAAAQLSALGLAVLYLRASGKLSWRLLGPVRPALRHVGIGLACGVVGFVAVQSGVGLAVELAGEADPPDQGLVSQFRDGGLVNTVIVVLAATALAPLVEEVVFRGVLFQAMRRRLGLWPGAVISGLVFGVVHLEVVTLEALPAVLLAVGTFATALLPRVASPAKVALAAIGVAALGWVVVVVAVGPVVFTLALAALGMLFAWAFHRTGSLLVPIVGHAAFNGTSLLALAVA